MSLFSVAKTALQLSLDLGERLAKIEELLACEAHTDAEKLAAIRQIMGPSEAVGTRIFELSIAAAEYYAAVRGRVPD